MTHSTETRSTIHTPDHEIVYRSDRTLSSTTPELTDRDWSSLTKDLINTLPRVWSRGLLYFLVGFTTIALPWAMLSKVDETGDARGRIEPLGRALELDAPVDGTVTKIQVKEGELVQKGQPLLELNSDISRAELQQLQAKLNGELNQVSQLELIRSQLQTTVPTQQLQVKAQQASQLAQISQSQQQLNSSRGNYTLAQDRLKRDRGEVERYQKLLSQGAVPQTKVVEVQQTMNESEQLLNQAQGQIAQARSEIKVQQSNYDDVTRTGELTLLESKRRIKEIDSQIADQQAQAAQTEKQIEGLQFQLRQRVLRAPVNGTIFQLDVKNQGAVLQPGQHVAQIAPEGAPLIFRAEIPSQNSGFLKVGLPVKLKFDAYPFQDYGIVPGHLRWISPDTKIADTPEGKIQVYELEIELEQRSIQGDGKRVLLSPGQTATAEVVVRQRHVIDFILDPFKKLQKDGLGL